MTRCNCGAHVLPGPVLVKWERDAVHTADECKRVWG